MRRIDFLHFIPFMLSYIYMLPFYFFYTAEEKTQVDRGLVDDFDLFSNILLVGFLVSGLSYSVISYWKLVQHERIIQDNYSNANLLNYNWLFSLITFFAIESLMATVKNFFLFAETSKAYDYSLRLTGVVELFFICWMVLKALHNPELFRGVNSNLQLVKNLLKEEMQVPYEIDHETKEIDEIIRLKKYMMEVDVVKF